MKHLLPTLFVLLLSTPLFSQSITIGTDGIVRCKGVSIGTTGTIFGEIYEVVDRNLLITRRDEGKDLTKVCVSNVTDMSDMFRGVFENKNTFNQPIGNWDVSSVTNMSRMFNFSQFNQPIGNWNVSSVTSMSYMFFQSSFNQPIGNWDVSSVMDMSDMFLLSPFNQPIGHWDVSSVTNMRGMFNSSPFNQPIGDWDVSSVTDMRFVFEQSSFNQPIGDWDVSSVTSMGYMFFQSPFNQPIGNWDVSKVTYMSYMFYQSQFNQPIGNWNVSSVTIMNNMFRESQFNQPIGNWDVSKVTDMSRMFQNNSQFNQPLNLWCISTIASEPSFFSSGSPLTQLNKPQWGLCPSPPKIILTNPIQNSTNVSLFTEFRWSMDSLSNKYQIQLIEGSDPIILDTLTTDNLLQLTKPLKGRVGHNWRVRGINDELKPTRFGEWSSIWGFTTQMEPVRTVTLLSPTNNSTVETLTPTLRWNKEPNSQTYTVQLSTDEFSTFIVNQTVTDTTLTTPTLKYSTTYRWRVRGSNTSGNGEWTSWRFTTPVDTSIEPEEQPTQFSLYQNYPNPFNPSTQIRFSLPQSTTVRLELFTITGQSISVLKDESMSIGIHTVTVDGKTLSSGVYIYRLTTPEYTQSRIMNLIK